MSHLIALSVGPVQEFISAARRTRDLWFGSYLLSEISKATARAAAQQGGRLIFPSPHSQNELEPESDLNVANIILCELESGDPGQVARQAQQAAQARWLQFAEDSLSNHGAVIRDDIWNDQVEDVIEFYAAWVVRTNDYPADRKRVMRLLAGRKTCRNFSPGRGRALVPKSSLDGLRESVLKPVNQWRDYQRSRLRINDGEQLDVVGVVKRTSGGDRSYPSVSRIAADPWLRGLDDTHLSAIADACEDLERRRILRRLNTSAHGYPQFEQFPFEGTAVFRSRHQEFCEEEGIKLDDLKDLRRALKDVDSEPSPYLAVLVADGDRMGQALFQLGSPEDHRTFSQTLSGFAAAARGILVRNQGICVYSGGDDVLAFVAVDHALSCARALHDEFVKRLQDWSQKTNTKLTLSVGLAIGHFMEPLEDLLNYGRAAEVHAKSPRAGDRGQSERNGLAIHLHKRGGGPVEVRANWNDLPDASLEVRLSKLAQWINARAISGRVAYDLRNIARLYQSWPESTVKDAIQTDTLSILSGKQPRGEKSRIDDVKQFVRQRVRCADDLLQISRELLIARQIAESLRLAARRNRKGEVAV